MKKVTFNFLILALILNLTSCSTLKKSTTYSALGGAVIGGILGKKLGKSLSPNPRSDPFNSALGVAAGSVLGAVVIGVGAYYLFKASDPNKNLPPYKKKDDGENGNINMIEESYGMDLIDPRSPISVEKFSIPVVDGGEIPEEYKKFAKKQYLKKYKIPETKKYTKDGKVIITPEREAFEIGVE
jgi:hypothetical protein